MASATTMQVVEVAVCLLLLTAPGHSTLSTAAHAPSFTSPRRSFFRKKTDTSNPYSRMAKYPSIFENAIAPPISGNLLYNAIAFPHNVFPGRSSFDVQNPEAQFSVMHFDPHRFATFARRDKRIDESSYSFSDKRNSEIHEFKGKFQDFFPAEDVNFRRKIGAGGNVNRKLSVTDPKFHDSRLTRIVRFVERDANANLQSFPQSSSSKIRSPRNFPPQISNLRSTPASNNGDSNDGHFATFRPEKRLAPTIIRSIPYSTYEERKVTPLLFNPIFLSIPNGAAQANSDEAEALFGSFNDAPTISPAREIVKHKIISPTLGKLKQNVPKSASNTFHSVETNGENLRGNSGNENSKNVRKEFRNGNRGTKLALDEMTREQSTSNFSLLTNDQKTVVFSHSHVGKFSQNPILNQPVGSINGKEFFEKLSIGLEFPNSFSTAGQTSPIDDTNPKNDLAVITSINHNSSPHLPAVEISPSDKNILLNSQAKPNAKNNIPGQNSMPRGFGSPQSSNEEISQQKTNVFQFSRGLDNNEHVYWDFPENLQKNEGPKVGNPVIKDGIIRSQTSKSKVVEGGTYENFGNHPSILGNSNAHLLESGLVKAKSNNGINLSKSQAAAVLQHHGTTPLEERPSSKSSNNFHSLFTDKSVHDIHAKNIQKVSSRQEVQKPTIIKLAGISLNSQLFFAGKEFQEGIRHVLREDRVSSDESSAADVSSARVILSRPSLPVLESSVKKLPPQKRCFYTSHTWMCPPQHLDIHTDVNEQTSQRLPSTSIPDLSSPSALIKQGFRNNFHGDSAIKQSNDQKGASSAESAMIGNTASPDQALNKANEGNFSPSELKLPHRPRIEPQKTIPSSVTKTPSIGIEHPKFILSPDVNDPKLTNRGSTLPEVTKFTSQMQAQHKNENPGHYSSTSKCSHSFHDYLCNENETNYDDKTIPNVGKLVTKDFDTTTERKPKPAQIIPTPSPPTPIILDKDNSPEPDPFASKLNVASLNRSTTNFFSNPHADNSVTNDRAVINSTPNSITKEPSVLKPDSQYDRCSHPFHAWLCQKPIRNRLSSLAVPVNFRTTPPTKQGNMPRLPETETGFSPPTNTKEDVFDDSELKSSEQNNYEAIRYTQTEKDVLNPYDIMRDVETPSSRLRSSFCKHPQHSWMCVHGQQHIHQTSSSKPPLQQVQNTKPASSNLPETKKIVSSFPDSGDPCLHSFHSWLCKLNRQNQSSNEPSLSSQVSLFLRNTVVSSTTKPIELSPGLTDVKLEKERKNVDPNTPNVPKKESDDRDHRTFDVNDPCSHPFHAHLCASIPTTPPPPTQNVLPILEPVPVPSSDNIKEHVPKLLPEVRLHKNPKDDKCSHPFHSWLCAVAQKLGADDKKSLSAIDSLIDSDRFLLKTSNLPNIRQLPLDTEDSTTEIRDFPEPSPLNAAQLAYSTQHWENLKYFRENPIKTTTSAPNHQVTSLPSVPSIGSKIIPTLPSLTVKEHGGPTPNPTSSSAFSFIDPRGHFSRTSSFKIHPQDSFNVPNPTHPGDPRVHSDPPRPTRDISSGISTRNEPLHRLPKDIILNVEEPSKSRKNSSTNEKVLPLASFTTDAGLQHNEKDRKMESGFSPSSHFGVHRLHPSPFMQFPSITGKPSSHSTENEPVVIIDSHFPDSVPSSTVSGDGSQSGRSFARVKIPKEFTRNNRNDQLFQNLNAQNSGNARINPPNFSLREQTGTGLSNLGAHSESPIRDTDPIMDNRHRQSEFHEIRSHVPVVESDRTKTETFARRVRTSHTTSKRARNTSLGSGSTPSRPMIFVPSARDSWGSSDRQISFVPSMFPEKINAQANRESGKARSQPDGQMALLKSSMNEPSAFHRSSSVVSEEKHTRNSPRNANYAFQFPIVPSSSTRHVRVVNHFVSHPEGGSSQFFSNLPSKAAPDPATFLVPPPTLPVIKSAPGSQASAQGSSSHTNRTRRKPQSKSEKQNRILYHARA